MKQVSMPNTGGDGLHYIAVKFSHLQKPVWAVKDGEGVYWVDLKSVVQSLGLAWHRWRLLIGQQRKEWRITSCLDRQLSETELIGETLFIGWLNSVEVALGSYPAHMEARAKLMRGGWWTRFSEAAGIEKTIAEAAKKTGRPQKVTEELVIRTHHLRRVVGKSISATAKDLEIGETTLKNIQAGNMVGWSAAAKTAWRQTFGQA